LEVHLELQIAASELDGDTGIALGMIVNELLMNSFKHGFGERFEREVARIRIDVSEQELKGHFVLLYEDNGAGMPTGAEWVTDERLGMRLIHQLARQLMGRLELKGSPRTQWVFHFLDEQRRRTID
jgi:two-component sensor histidine kinase